MAYSVEPIVWLIATVLFVLIAYYIIWNSRREEEAKIDNRIKKMLENKLKREKRLSYGDRYKCGYCSYFGKTTDCPRDYATFSSEPCDIFELTTKS
jgi:hypothetical protein